MAGDTVTTIFGGDDSTFQAAARKVKDTVASLASHASPMHFFEKAKEGAEGLHKASEHAKEGIESLKSALEPLIAMGAALIGVETIFEGIKHSIEQASERESAGFHFEAIAGGADKAASAIGKLEEISAQTATDFPILAKGAEKLMEAGESADSAAESMGSLQKIALNTGSDVNELGEIYAKVLTKSDVTSKDLVKLAMAGVPGIKQVAAEFKGVERETTSANLAIDKTIQGLNRIYEQAEKQASSVNSFGSKIGLMQASFAAWAKSGGNAIGGLVQAIGGVGESGIGKMSGTFGKEFTEGLQQIESETGLSVAALQRFMAEGKVGYDELIAAAGRYREEAHKQQDADLEQEKLNNQNALLEKQKGLLGEVRGLIEKATNKGGIFASVEAFFETFQGKWQQVQHSIDETFEAFGKPLMDSLKPALDQIYGFFKGPGIEAVGQWGTALGGVITDAMQGLMHGNWAPLEKDGEAAFATILKYASKGMDDLGIVLAAACQGPGMLTAIAGLTRMLRAAAEAFGEAMMQSASAPLRKLEQLDVLVNPVARYAVQARDKGEYDKFTDAQKQQFTDMGGGQKSATESWTGGNISRDSEIIAKIKGFSGVLEHITEAGQGATQAVTGLAEVAKTAAGNLAGGDAGSGDNGEDDWMRRNHLEKYKVEPSADPAATASPAEIAVPLATAAATISAAQATPGRAFSGFSVPSPSPARSGASVGSSGGRSSGSGGSGDDTPSVFTGKTSKERWASYDSQWGAYNAKHPGTSGAIPDLGSPFSQAAADTPNFAAKGTGQSYMGGPSWPGAAGSAPTTGSITAAPAAPAPQSASKSDSSAGLPAILSKIDQLIAGLAGLKAVFTT